MTQMLKKIITINGENVVNVTKYKDKIFENYKLRKFRSLYAHCYCSVCACYERKNMSKLNRIHQNKTLSNLLIIIKILKNIFKVLHDFLIK